MSTTESEGFAPLKGVLVLEFGHALAAPVCTCMLSDLGARVIKVEPPSGDTIRSWPPFLGGQGSSFLSANRNKESIVVDLKSDEGRALARRLAARANIVVENLKPGDPERYGIDYQTMRQENPGIIYCAITGYGSVGPLVNEPAYDVVIQGYSGAMSITGEPSGPPQRVGVSISDMAAATQATIGVLAAYAQWQATGKGALVEVTLLGSLLNMMSNSVTNYLSTGNVPRRWGTGHPNVAPYQVFPSATDDMIVGAASEDQWRRLCTRIEHAELLTDERFLTVKDRVEHRSDLQVVLGAIFQERPADDWITRLRGTGVICGKVQTVAQAVDGPQVAALGLVETVEHSTAGEIRLLANPLRFDQQVPEIRSAPPTLGQHTDAILSDIGLSAAEVAALRESGTVR